MSTPVTVTPTADLAAEAWPRQMWPCACWEPAYSWIGWVEATPSPSAAADCAGCWSLPAADLTTIRTHLRKGNPGMPEQAPPFPQNPDHGNGTCEQCGAPCAVCGPRWCPACYYVNGVPRDLIRDATPVAEHPGADCTLAGPVDECEGLDGQPIAWASGELGVCYYQ